MVATLSFKTDVYPFIQSKCASCHNGSAVDGSLDLTSESKAFTNLTTGTAAESGCTAQYVVSGDATSSLLYQKVSGSGLTRSCGSQMPYLTSANVTTVQDWINQGAAP